MLLVQAALTYQHKEKIIFEIFYISSQGLIESRYPADNFFCSHEISLVDPNPYFSNKA